MKFSVQKLIAFLLAAGLLTGCGRNTAAPEEPDTEAAVIYTAVPTATLAPTATPAPAAAATPGPTPVPDIHADVDWVDMHWEVRGLDEFRAAAEELSRTADGARAEDLYAWLMEEYTRLRTWNELAWIDFYASGGGDETLSAACQQLDEDLTQARDLLLSALSGALNGPASRTVSETLGEDAALELADYEPMTDREAELSARETELVLAYEAQADPGVRSAAQNRRLGAIFLELLEVRRELASLYGYDSYADYAYEAVYGRDFTPEDAAALCRAVKPWAGEYFRSCYAAATDIAFYDGELPAPDAGELLDLLRAWAPRLSDGAASAESYMERHGLFHIDRSPTVSFTTYLPSYRAPFLYISLDGSIYDLQTAFHEFGHYCDAYLNPEPEGLSEGGCYDVFEIHSTGLEALACSWYDEIFPGRGDMARIVGLDSLVYNVISGCIYDEFLQYVYARPGLTLSEINTAFAEIAASYGAPMGRMAGRYYWTAYDWMNVNHNFGNPFYYISYTASSLAALQIWTLSQTDYDSAEALYNAIVERGAYEVSYGDLLAEMGLLHFRDDPDGCLAPPVEALTALCRAYEAGEAAA